MKTRTQNLFPGLTAAHATQIGVNDADAAGSWIMLLPLGRFSGRDGRGPYDAGTSQTMAQVIDATLKRAGSTELVIDYDHQSMFSAVPGVGGIAPAAGWIKSFEVRNEGLFGRVEWTDKAAQAIKAGEYRYISPVYHHDKSGKVLRLISAGLTNTPNLDLAAVAASASFNTQGNDMEQIAIALGLAQGASEADILAAINAALVSVSAIAVTAGLDKAAKPADVATAVATMRTGIDKVATASGLTAGATTDTIATAVQAAVAGQVDPAQYVPIAQVTAMQASLKALTDRVINDDAETAVNKAITEGKMVPALRDWGLNLHRADKVAFDAFVGAAPVLTASQRASAAAPNSSDPNLSESDLAVMSQLGLTRDQMVAARKGVGE